MGYLVLFCAVQNKEVGVFRACFVFVFRGGAVHKRRIFYIDISSCLLLLKLYQTALQVVKPGGRLS